MTKETSPVPWGTWTGRAGGSRRTRQSGELWLQPYGRLLLCRFDSDVLNDLAVVLVLVGDI